MALTIRKLYNAPAGWTDAAAVAEYSGVKGVHCVVVSFGEFGAIVWGGALAPTAGEAFQPLGFQDDSGGTASNIWVRGPCSYSITITG